MARTRRGAPRPRPPRPVAPPVRSNGADRVSSPTRTATLASAGQPNASAPPSDRFAGLMERASQGILAATYWFDPVPRPEPYPVTIRFSGHRIGVPAKEMQPADSFTHDETIDEVVPGSGPVALTARIRGVNAGEWEVKAGVLDESARLRRGRQQTQQAPPLDGSLRHGILAHLWLRWAPQVDPSVPQQTQLEPFIHVPGLIPLIWGIMVTLGFAVAVAEQALMLSHLRLHVGPALFSTLGAIAAGIGGAKVWYIVKHRRKHDFIGWCIQGFITGATAGAIVLFLITRVPVGTVLDATAPGLMLGMAVGRVGCFFAGCCGGPPTAARWGVWCSDQHVGARRVPTQLMESLFCLLVGVATFVAVWFRGPAGGAYFVAAVAAYTLFREWILRLRSEPLSLRVPAAVIPVVSALVLIGACVVLVR
jgi:phosphatidylglycerol---prolipoprotein diacylglyceryl transferase